jgi:hypothetical protein
MNNVVQYVSYGYYGRNNGCDFSCNSGVGDDRNTDDGCDFSCNSGVGDDRNKDDDDEDNNKYDDDDEEGDLFWLG